MNGIHCDGPGCQTWATPRMAKKAGFLSVLWMKRELHFCSWDCCLKYGATKEPLTVVE